MIAAVEQTPRSVNPVHLTSETLTGFCCENPTAVFGGCHNRTKYAYVGNDPVNRFDPGGLYGTNDCSYCEQRCQEFGGDYYCDIAQTWCNRFPKSPDPDPSRDDDFEGWARCTRQCLQDCDRVQSDRRNPWGGQTICPAEPDPATDEFWDQGSFECHAACYTGCAAWGIGIGVP